MLESSCSEGETVRLLLHGVHEHGEIVGRDVNLIEYLQEELSIHIALSTQLTDFCLQFVKLPSYSLIFLLNKLHELSGDCSHHILQSRIERGCIYAPEDMVLNSCGECLLHSHSAFDYSVEVVRGGEWSTILGITKDQQQRIANFVASGTDEAEWD
ncbi:hypothetical protein FOMPIDRAFT_1016981 [Fomitopsis schrenkii]|uniref:Uncharacterized protein n=1 Tax=Fomitopsis schrenkii TaxID=2126942 RepID=S8E8Q4_FOMSC|nr:hypothetical protein FOMPIDRAFT_1016981 [Fomitopsis schrenkii]